MHPDIESPHADRCSKCGMKLMADQHAMEADRSARAAGDSVLSSAHQGGKLLFRWRRQGKRDTFVLGAYLLLAGSIRFAIEFVRVNQRVLGPLSVAHLASMLAIFIGVWLLASRGSTREG